MNTTFVYVTFIRTTQEKLWDALTRPEFTRAYWYGAWHDTNWQRGSPWKLMIPDGRVGDSGEILEIEKPHRLVLKWKNEFRSELREEGYSRCTLELEAQGETVKLTVCAGASSLIFKSGNGSNVGAARNTVRRKLTVA